jgi:uncharacterized protein YecA (UPF0149 family)
VSNTVFRVTITREPVVQAPRQMTEGRVEMGDAMAAASAAGSAVATASATGAGGNGNAAAASPQTVRGGPKIGRNDPCWCGSGKKYKRCHGA